MKLEFYTTSVRVNSRSVTLCEQKALDFESKLLALVPHGACDKKNESFPQVVGKVFQYVLVEDPKEEKGQMLLKLTETSLREF